MWSLDSTVAAFAILQLISGSREMLDPRYRNRSTVFSSFMTPYVDARWGGGGDVVSSLSHHLCLLEADGEAELVTGV